MADVSDDQELRDALMQALEPLARVMIARGVTIGQGTELLKHGMIDAALAVGDEDDPSDSRISMLTGLHRKDVRRIRRDEAKGSKKASAMNACSLAISHWLNAPDFTDAAGQPRPLGLSKTSSGPTFGDLIKAAKIDLPAATVLDELSKNEIVVTTLVPATVTLVKRAYVPAFDSPERLKAFGKNIGAHLAAAGENLTTDGPAPHYEVGGHYNGLSSESIAALSELAARTLQSALETIDREAARRQQADETQEDTGRFSFGAYARAPSIRRRRDNS